MERQEANQRLKYIHSEFYGISNFTILTMAQIEERAKEVRSMAMKILGEEDEVTGEMESVIFLSKEYKNKGGGWDNEIIREAIRHLEYGVDLFLEKI